MERQLASMNPVADKQKLSVDGEIFDLFMKFER
jgi:hypothetical protein